MSPGVAWKLRTYPVKLSGSRRRPTRSSDDDCRAFRANREHSFWAAQAHVGNVLYGCAKAATDKLTADMAHELASYGVNVVSLDPGLVRTEAVMAAAGFLDLSNSESPEFIGRAVFALARDPQQMGRSGRTLVAAQLALDYGFTDIDGRQPRPLALVAVQAS